MSGSASLRDWLAEVRRFASVKHRTIALAVLRICIGLTLLVYYSQHILQREYLWGNSGLVPFPLFQHIMQFRHGLALPATFIWGVMAIVSFVYSRGGPCTMPYETNRGFVATAECARAHVTIPPRLQRTQSLCGSARPVPILDSLSPTTITFAEVQKGVVLTVNGSHFVSSSVVVINGTTLSTTEVSTQELQVTITTAVISGPGTANVTVNTPGGSTGGLGCTSGGTSGALVLTIT